jgi:hypothetical protein
MPKHIYVWQMAELYSSAIFSFLDTSIVVLMMRSFCTLDDVMPNVLMLGSIAKFRVNLLFDVAKIE